MMKKLSALAVVVAMIAVTGIGLVIAPAPAQAYSGCAANTSCGWLYYSDAAHTHQVGGHTTNCQGSVLDWGITTGHSVAVSQICGGGIPLD
jgi:uncharacterized protein DUF6289